METKNNFQVKLSRDNKVEKNTLFVTPSIALIDTPYSVTLTKSLEKFSYLSKFQDSNENIINIQLDKISGDIGEKSGRIYLFEISELSLPKSIKDFKNYINENQALQKSPRFMNNIKFSLKLIKVLSDNIDKRLPNNG